MRKKSTVLMNCFGQSVCGIGIVKGYYAHQKFNVMEIANIKNAESELGGEGRVTAHEREARH
jgi:thiamine biosynthesis lipoprotein ApbE